MTLTSFTESTVESAALDWLVAIRWRIAYSPNISPAGDTLTLALSRRERENYGDVVPARHFRDTLLPKLISGELQVKDTTTFIERTTA